MKGLFYSWTLFQILVGAWLFISPSVFGVSEFYAASNSMLLGGLLAILGVGMIFYELYHRERVESGSFLQRLFYPWIAVHFLIGIWLFVSPFVLGFPGTRLAVNGMLFGSIVIALGIGTFFFELYHKEEFEALKHAEERL